VIILILRYILCIETYGSLTWSDGAFLGGKVKEKIRFSLKLSWVITYAVVAYLIATDIYTPSMPSITRYFGATEDLIQLTMASFMLGAFASTLCSGALAENFGRRRIFIGGQLLSVLVSFLCIVVQDPYLLIVARFLQGLGCAVASVIGFSAVQDNYSPKESARIFSVMGAAFAVIPALAPTLGGHLDQLWGWRSNFMAIFFFLSCSCLLSYLFFHLPEKNDQRVPSNLSQVLKTYASILRNKKFLRYGMMNPIFISGEWFYLTILPFYFIQVIGVSAPVYGYYLGAMLVSYAIGTYLATKLIDSIGHDKTIKLAFMTSIWGGGGLLITHVCFPKSPEAVAVCIGIYLIGQGLSFTPSITKTLESFDSIRASASSVRSSISALFAVLGTLAASFFNDFTLIPLGLYIIFLSLAGLFLFSFLRQNEDS